MEEILLVDDDPDFLGQVRRLLEAGGMRVYCAASGEDALDNLSGKSFDLMITDYDMPGLDGICLTRHSAIIAPDMPVILMTGNIASEIPLMAKKAGVAKVLGKPFSCEALLETIRGLTVTRSKRADMEVNPMTSVV